MAGQHRLRQEYLRRVCRALSAYIERDARGVHIHSCNCEGRLDITFSIDDVEVFHDLTEGRDPRRNADNPPPAA